MNFAVIMAGGRGTRFWPKSRQSNPKQFLSLASSKPMITDTLNRIAPVVPKKNTYVITNKVQLSKARKICRALPINNIIAEPVGRNTAPCLGLAALFAKKKDPKEDGVLIALPADHIIKNEKKISISS